MAVRAGKAAGDLSHQVLDEARSTAFFQLVERLYKVNNKSLEKPYDLYPKDELIRYEVSPELGFPGTDVLDAGVESVNGAENYFIQLAFMGLHGSNSPLPRHYLDELACEPMEQDHGVRVPFLNFFNHRLVTLLHRAWRKYRYSVRFESNAEDRFSQYVYSLIGMNDEALRGDTPLPWSRMLTYIGMISTRSRAPSMVSGIVAHCFSLKHVSIREWVERYVDVPKQQMNKLAVANITLGDNFVAGDRVLTPNSKFIVSIKSLSQQRYRDFLPSGDTYKQLRALLAFLLRDQLAYDLELGLLHEEVPPFTLDEKKGSHLGWTTFLGDVALGHETLVSISGGQ